MPTFDIEALTSARDRRAFSCGVAALDRYLAEFANQDIKRRVSNCYVALDESGVIAAFYTFAASSLPVVELSAEQAKRLPRYPLVPVALIGRLAVDERYKGRRLGSALIADALLRCSRANAAVYALLVDAKDEAAAQFYTHLGFMRCMSRKMSLYLPVATALPRPGA